MMIDITIKHVLISITFAFIFYVFSKNHQLVISNLRLVYKPTFYHGELIHRNFFEGWYYKTVTNKGDETLIIIPGIYKSTSSNDEASHAFVMIFRDEYECLYYRYGLEEFNATN